MRRTSQLTDMLSAISAWMMRSGALVCSSSTTCRSIASIGASGISLKRHATTQAATGEVHHIVDQARHAGSTSLIRVAIDRVRSSSGVLREQFRSAGNGRERIAQIMAQHRYELLTKR